MSTTIKLHELTGSPNNVKVRIALGYKGLDYERLPLDFESFPGDRSPLVKISRQPRTPVLQHGDTTIFDSRGILRYLEANFPDTPTIFTDDYAEFGEIERWEAFGQQKLGEPIGMLFGQAFAPEPDAQVITKANAMINEVLGAFEDELSTKDFLVSDHLTAADIGCACGLYLADQTEKSAQASPISGFFHANMNMGENRPKTRAWVRRVVAYDPVKGWN